MIKKVALVFAVLVVVIAGGIYYFASNLDSIVKAAIEKYGSEATQAKVSLKAVELSPAQGSGSLKGLVVGNPKGFSTPEAMALGDVSISLDIGSLQSNPIVIKQVLIEQPAITYEYGAAGSNLQAIQKNVQAYAAGFGGGSGGKADSGASAGGDKGSEKKVVIQDLVISGGKIGISAAALQGRSLSSPLPTIHLKDIGKDKGGASPAEVAQKIIGTISAEASQIAARDLQKQLGSMLKDGAGAAGGAAGGATDKLKGLLGK
ncbi:hypothetical protein [Ferrovibrio xuzhouensis]|uniref:AsmA domain-containing protein n=1 Tax=Ferrovibrio xuzhouensis TaxID=1576914 RepID=A0ABV7VBK7_9PROT